MAATTWSELQQQYARGRKAGRVDARSAKAAAAQLGLAGWPPGYLEYLEHFGGRTQWTAKDAAEESSQYLIILHPHEVPGEVETLKRLLGSSASAPVRERLATLLPFGTDAGETFFCFEPTTRVEGGELNIYQVDYSAFFERDPDKVMKLCASNFFDFLVKYWLAGRAFEGESYGGIEYSRFSFG